MKVAVLIGFSYGEDSDIPIDDPERTPLPGIVVDLYQAYVASMMMDVEKIIIITDIIRDQQTSVLLNAMLHSTVDVDILTFIETIKHDQTYHHFSGKEDFMRCISDTITEADEIFIYYTGHVSHGYLLFPVEEPEVTFVRSPEPPHDLKTTELNEIKHVNAPDDSPGINLHRFSSSRGNSRLSLIDFRTLILTSADRNAQVFMVMDCCNGNGLGLPFQMLDGIYRLTNNEPRIYTTQEVVCLSSTMSDENSITSRDGSIFTRSLFKQMKEKEQSIKKMLDVVGKECITRYEQTATVHASYPNSKILWNWVYGPTSIDIVANYSNNTIIVDFEKSVRSDFYSDSCRNICLLVGVGEPVSMSETKYI